MASNLSMQKEMFMKSIFTFKSILLIGIVVFTACGGGSSSTQNKTIGYLIDAPVVNMTYQCGGITAQTDMNGKFECTTLPVVFTVGSVTIGTLSTITDDSKVYPQDLAGVSRENVDNAEVLKIASFLQSLDDDGDISTAINISDNVQFTVSKNLSELSQEETNQLLEDEGITPVSLESAENHLIENTPNLEVTPPSDTTIPVLNNWVQPRDSSIISISTNVLRSTANGSATYGMSKAITNLVIGKEYTLSYSFLTGTSTNSYGRISEDSYGTSITYRLFHNKNLNQEGTYTFTATQTTMYVAFLSTTDNAYIEVESVNLDGKNLLELPEDFSDWTEARESSSINVSNTAVRSTADGSATFGMSKAITNLVIGEEYTLSYSFLTGTSTNSYGRI